MRFIDTANLEERLTQNWKKRAQRATELVAKADPRDRADLIKGRQAVWSAVKPILAELSHEKCWYCEHRPIRDPLKVDHFRPKSGVTERPDHRGYWWLAFVPSNFRLACTFCNSVHTSRNNALGKQNHFPVIDETKRAMSETASIIDEEPGLLDPTSIYDAELLWFREDGRVVYCDADALPDDAQRVRTESSITIYDLNGIKLEEARRDRMRMIRDLVDDADELLSRRVQGGLSEHDDDKLSKIMKRLLEYVDDSAEFSIAGLHVLLASRDSVSASSILANLGLPS